ncbi:ABC transporter permease [Amphibacillus jilinensis]|uniref:ABC transporter permease n=1 Tax=Amphibacillus jilinensis TaxID=1216008 RepID=UPI00031B483D|nr:FtsX-like permease family protein [Amphibacillus jilinensis]
MIHFIWQNWKRKKERLLLLLLGVVVIATGLSYLVGLSDRNQLTITEELQQSWQSSYHIAVRPTGTRGETEHDQLLDTNFLSGISGGISTAQYEQIKAMTDIEIAAPIAFIGHVYFFLEFDNPHITEPGLYRFTSEHITGDGINQLTDRHTSYQSVNNHPGDSNFMADYYHPLNETPNLIMQSQLLAAIDPVQEAALVGLDQAVLDIGNSRYFSDQDQATPIAENSYSYPLPILLSNRSYTHSELVYTYEKLEIEIDDDESPTQIYQRLESLGGQAYLDDLDGEPVEQFRYDDYQLFSYFANSLSRYDLETGEPYSASALLQDEFQLFMKVAPLAYKQKESPLPEQWPNAYQLKTVTIDSTINDQGSFTGYRNEERFDQSLPLINPEWIGFYDPSHLNIAQDPTTELPMETYRPIRAELVFNPDLQPFNPPIPLEPIGEGYSFLTSPPSMLTTLDYAEHILGNQIISAIRIKVKGVEGLTEQSQAKLEQIAERIEQETGLITDIMLGSSPQQTLVYLPQSDTDATEGWFQQPWIKLGAAMSIFREATLSYTTILLMTITVAVLYVWATGLINLQARKKELAILLAVGWRPRQVGKLLLTESVWLGGLTALISWLILGFVYWSENISFSPIRFVSTGISGWIIYLLGSILPIMIASKISPIQTMQHGEIATSRKSVLPTIGVITMALNHFIRKWQRYVLSVVTIALPSSLLTIFLYITLRLQGVMYTTSLGQYIAIDVGPIHYTAAIVALVIALLTTVEMIWQNVSERQPELAILKTVGWRANHVRLLIWLEGFFTGLLASILAFTFAFSISTWLEQTWPSDRFIYLIWTGCIPLVVGLIGSIIPAERAVRLTPINGIHSGYSNRAALEKWLKWFAIIGVFGLIITFVCMLFLLFS